MAWMDRHNLTILNEFILMGITALPELQSPLFALFLIVYMVSVVGNLGLIILTKMDSRLQTPMYFFLRHLAFTDLGYSTAVGPKMLVNIATDQHTISYNGCATQLTFFSIFIINEVFILSAMAYDRYVAICNPLLYTVVMSPRTCQLLVAIPYVYSVFLSLLVIIKIFTSFFCGYNVIRHFYCDSLPLISLLCSDTHEIKLIILIFAAFNLASSLPIVLVSYLLILGAILRVKSAEGRLKAFSTCGSHLAVIVIFYGTLFFMYVQPKSSHSLDTDQMASVFYTLIIPMLNPMIYSLRNKEVKGALTRTWSTCANALSGPSPPRQSLIDTLGLDIRCSWQDSVSDCPAAPRLSREDSTMWPPTVLWHLVAELLMAWAPPEDWEAVEPTPEAVREALGHMEMSIPMAHRELAGQVARLLLSVLRKQVVTGRDQRQQMQHLKQAQESLEQLVHAMETHWKAR
ncbi:olfactory receptor 8K3-like [Hipposideros larvatus]